MTHTTVRLSLAYPVQYDKLPAEWGAPGTARELAAPGASCKPRVSTRRPHDLACLARWPQVAHTYLHAQCACPTDTAARLIAAPSMPMSRLQ